MEIEITCLIIILNSLLSNCLFIPKPLPEDARLNFTGLGFKYGHKVEEHSVVSEDGYILTVFRIPGKKKTPVMLTHGIADSSDTFIIRGKRSLAISLADAGYDVWATNTRGNRYARRHVKMDPDKDPSFWDYSFHENGYYDTAATIDYILQTTGEKKLQGIAHSQGTSSHFVLLSMRPEYNDKLKLFVALAPVAYFNNIVPPVSSLAQIGPDLNQLLLNSKIEELVSEKGIERKLIKLICNQGDISYDLCVLLSGFYVSGFDAKRLEPSFLPVILGHYPAATSRKSLLHYDQVYLNKRFALFDYGPMQNMERYGYMVPPDYNLRQVTAKIALIVGNNDNLSRARDAEYLRTLLPNIVQYHVMKEKEWNHIDFIWGNDMPETLFPYIFPLLEKYS
ncbi:hypothetical protein MSG28_012184 [Choristoneura fumiferana]|uniref:Uncharacterized protein n=2 Tax=Choristoneura fumiferana TaxID=7141 RepID=A0ACC0KCE5_CHOFU|nr:hypothetical protein MSG28_012184 [Choristoneura fumiferana]